MLRSEEGMEGWVFQPPIPERRHPAFMRYEFKYHSVSLSTCSINVGFGMLGIGPPLIPIVPIMLFPHTNFDPSTEYAIDDLFLYVQVDSPEETSSIDFSTIAVIVNNSHSKLNLKSVRRYNPDQRWSNVCGRHLRSDDKVVSPKQLISNESVQYLLVFDYPWREVESFSLNFGTLLVGDQKINILPLAYSKASYYFYVPFIIPPGEEDPHPVIFYGGYKPGVAGPWSAE